MEIQNKGNFFGRDKNCSNEIFNFYQNFTFLFTIKIKFSQ